MKNKLEIRIFLCFILTILYVHYVVETNRSDIPKEVEVIAQPLKGFEVRIVNDQANERLELTDTLEEAVAYIKEYSMHHDDLIAFDLSTGEVVGQ